MNFKYFFFLFLLFHFLFIFVGGRASLHKIVLRTLTPTTQPGTMSLSLVTQVNNEQFPTHINPVDRERHGGRRISLPNAFCQEVRERQESLTTSER